MEGFEVRDCRLEFVDNIKVGLLNEFNPDDARKISNILFANLENYAITNKSSTLMETDTSLDNLLDMFLVYLNIRNRSKKTIECYKNNIKMCFSDINKPLKDIDEMDLMIWFAKRQQKVTMSTVSNERASLSTFYNWLSKKRLIDHNPMDMIDPIKYTTPIESPFTGVEVDTIKESIRGGRNSVRLRAEFELLLSTGIRANELCSLNKSDIDFAERTVTIRHGKGDKPRVVYFNDVAKHRLNQYLATRNDDDECLFLTRNKTRLTVNSLENDFRKLSELSGVEHVHPHRCRKTFATRCIASGMKLRVLQELLGHANLAVTTRYLQFSHTYIKNEYDNMIA